MTSQIRSRVENITSTCSTLLLLLHFCCFIGRLRGLPLADYSTWGNIWGHRVGTVINITAGRAFVFEGNYSGRNSCHCLQ